MTVFIISYFTNYIILKKENSTVYLLVIWRFIHLIYSASHIVLPWCSGYHYRTTSFNKVWTQVLRRFKSCSRGVGDSRWWVSLTMVPAGNKAKRVSSVNHTTKTIHHHLATNIARIYQIQKLLLVNYYLNKI